MKSLSLRRLLQKKQTCLSSPRAKDALRTETEQLQLEMLRIQQGIWHGRGRAILVFEGFDAAGKGGAIRALTEKLDPRGVNVHPIAAPTDEEKARHWMNRFWANIPRLGTISIFDRSWYGRVLVEKVERLAPEHRIRDAYREINEFERMLAADGIKVLKFFLAISKAEQLKRFCDRLEDPYKQWKITEDDIRARHHWNAYVSAADAMFAKTNCPASRWLLVPADHKAGTRVRILRDVTRRLKPFGNWIEKKAAKLGRRSLLRELKKLGHESRDLK